MEPAEIIDKSPSPKTFMENKSKAIILPFTANKSYRVPLIICSPRNECPKWIMENPLATQMIITLSKTQNANNTMYIVHNMYSPANTATQSKSE